jgi:hypothetical protein
MQSALAVDGVYLAATDAGTLGTVAAGDLSATWTADGTAQKIAEGKDGSGNYRLDWTWRFDGIQAADRFQLRVTAQATNSKQGMDHYRFLASTDGQGWQEIGSPTRRPWRPTPAAIGVGDSETCSFGQWIPTRSTIPAQPAVAGRTGADRPGRRTRRRRRR